MKLYSAIDAWLEAQERERTGEMGRAISLYRKAEKLDPAVYQHIRHVPIGLFINLIQYFLMKKQYNLTYYSSIC